MAKRKKKKRSWSFPKISLPEITREDWHRALVTTLIVALVGGLVATWIIYVPKLEAYATEIAENESEPINITFTDRPIWVEGQIATMLEQTIMSRLSRDPLAREDLVAVREGLLNSGWFQMIHQVRRKSADEVVIDAVWMIPYAVVREDDGDHLIDPRGRLLPWVFTRGEAESFMVIEGNRFPGPNRPGMQWEGADIAAVLELQKLIDQQEWRDQVEAIDVTGQLRGDPMRLITDRGTHIIWGSPPGEEEPLEALVERKLAFLNHHYENHNHIDAGHDGEIDITSHQAVFQR